MISDDKGESKLKDNQNVGDSTAMEEPSDVQHEFVEPSINLIHLHLPVFDKRGRCKFSGCKGQSVFRCESCGIHLCLNKTRNCFYQFHSLFSQSMPQYTILHSFYFLKLFF